MRPDDLLDAIGEIGEDKIQRAHEPVKRRLYRKWMGPVAAVLAIAMLAGVLLRGGDKTPDSQNALAPYRIAAVTYPEAVQRPDSEAYTGADGQVDWNALSEARQKWYASTGVQYKDMNAYRGRLDGFLAASIPAFLDGEAGENRVYSPLNVYLALAMLSETTGGESQQQLLALLGAADTAELRQYAKALWNANYVDDGVSESLLSSSLWLNQDIAFVQSTMDTLAADYYAESYRGEAGSDGFNAALREWLNERTGGLLREQVANVELTEQTILAILTAVYFRAPWDQEFPASRTAPDTFHAPSGDVTCDFMHGGTEGAYYWGENFSAVEKPLTLSTRGGSMWFLLPDEGVTPEALLGDEEAMRFLLTNKHEWNGGQPVWENQANVIVHLNVPKFDVSSETDLAGGLKALGVTDVFAPDSADFSPMVQNADALLPFVSKAVHAARVMIDEEGVVAAAYTEIGMDTGSSLPPAEEIDFTLDRPFLFAITGADELPLFVGVVNQP